jgi:hypothetical protein
MRPLSHRHLCFVSRCRRSGRCLLLGDLLSMGGLALFPSALVPVRSRA